MAKKKAVTAATKSTPQRKPAKKKATKSSASSSERSSSSKAAPRKALKVVERPSDIKGIQELVWVEADSLTENPDNWKTHTDRQQKAIDSELKTVGWAGAMLYNLETGRMIDGHGRKKTDHVRQTGIVPVMVGRWTPEEEKQILLHLDPIGAMFETQQDKFRKLMASHKEDMAELSDQIESHHAEQLNEVNTSLEVHCDSLDYGAPKSFLPDYKVYDDDAASDFKRSDDIPDVATVDQIPSKLPGAFDLKLWIETPFEQFCKRNKHLFDIPPLRPDRLCSLPENVKIQPWVGPETPVADHYLYIYGSAAIEKVRSSDMLVAFYTYDEKFESVWNDPRKLTARMINMKVRGVISVNFSIWHGAPLAFQIWQTYRTRWLARYWQEAGLNVIPDIMLSEAENEDYLNLRLTGIPKGCPCVSVQVQQKGSGDKESVYAAVRSHIFRMHKKIEPKQLLLYHGPDLPKNFCRDFPSDMEVIKVPTWMTERSKILKEKEYVR